MRAAASAEGQRGRRRRPSELDTFGWRVATSLIAIPWVLLGFLGGSAGAGTFVVDGSSPSCSDAGPGSAAVPYCTISAAISAHQGPGTTLQVQPAVYREQVVVPSSGVDGSPFVLQGSGGAVIEGADDFSSDTLWTPASGDVYLAPRVTWAVQQVFADGQRLTPMTGDVTALPARSFSYVAGTGL